jgi:TRAP-type C4-dicarboxylate transport system permease small subunit
MKKVLPVISTIFEIATTILFINLLICVGLQILFRYVLKISVPWTEEGARYIFIWMVFLGSVVTFANDQNVRLTILSGKFSPKTEVMIDVFGALVVIVFCAIFFRGSIQMAQLNWQLPSLTMPGIYMGYLFISSILSCFMILVFSIVQLIEKFKTLTIR